jgi:hypothetical protein
MPQVQALQCPNCGGTVQLRGYAQTVNAVCEHCLSILDTSTPALRILQEAQSREQIKPMIPLGTRGKFDKVVYEAIGFQVRTITVEGTEYSWREYLLFNPYQGYRYLTEYDYHWNFVRTLQALPQPAGGVTRPRISYGGKMYTRFQTATARTAFVLGEFPWQVRVGETVQVSDYVAPPEMISAEETPQETVWSHAVYLQPAELWKSFGLPGNPPPTYGVYANQPSPYTGKPGGIWGTFFFLAMILMAAWVGLGLAAHRWDVFEQRYNFSSLTHDPAAFVTPNFQVQGRPENLDIEITADSGSDPAQFSVSLVSEDSGQAWDFGSEVGGDAPNSADFRVARVAPGNYYLRVEPSFDPSDLPPDRGAQVSYRVRVSAGGISWWPFLVGFVLLLVPPIVSTIRRYSFETARWQEAD